ncbi:MAG: pyroglutamyl-peptidase I [Cyanobacteria bacterium SZAS TMP-1]|nr:pyroglutamyl-peptidase I [Cyanobacteria bacterium SZAS TMP-1]
MVKKQKTPKKRSDFYDEMPITVLLTGFDAFAGNKHNPSQLVVESFPDILKSKARGQSKHAKEIHILKQVLPTAGVKGWKVLKKAIDSTLDLAEGPVIVIMLGLAAVRETISLERLALNFRDYRVADNNGEQRLEETIESKAPQLLRTNLDLRHLQEIVSAAGYPCDVSNHAGTFVCNELYFRALNYKRELGDIETILFMHLPLEKVFAKTAKKAKTKDTPKSVSDILKSLAKDGKKRQIEFMQQAVIEVIENIVHGTVSYKESRRINVE